MGRRDKIKDPQVYALQSGEQRGATGEDSSDPVRILSLSNTTMRKWASADGTQSETRTGNSTQRETDHTEGNRALVPNGMVTPFERGIRSTRDRPHKQEEASIPRTAQPSTLLLLLRRESNAHPR